MNSNMYGFYDYYFSHYEIDVDEKVLDDGESVLTKTYRIDNEYDAIKYANKRYKEGKRVEVRMVQFVENWIDIYED